MRLKYLPFFVVTALVAFAVITFADDEEDRKSFEQFKKEHNKNYDGGDGKSVKSNGEKSEAEEKAYDNYRKNCKRVREHNADPSRTYDQETNENDDMSDEEKEAHYKGSNYVSHEKVREEVKKAEKKEGRVKGSKDDKPKSVAAQRAASALVGRDLYVGADADPSATSCPIAATMDFRGSMSAVKNQGACGSNWALAAISLMEAEARSNKSSLSYSDQNVVDCNQYAAKCGGGDSLSALYYMRVRGVPLEKDYKYTGKNQTCRNVTTPYTKTRNICYTGNNETLIQQVLNRYQRPVIAFLATLQSGFMNYKSGVFADSKCSKNVSLSDVMVTISGYGKNANGSFWLVRGTYGTSWGQGGYMQIRRGTNECGVGNLVLSLCDD